MKEIKRLFDETPLVLMLLAGFGLGAILGRVTTVLVKVIKYAIN